MKPRAPDFLPDAEEVLDALHPPEDTVKRFGGETLGHAKSAKAKLSGKIPGRKFRRGGDDSEDDQTE